MYKFWSKENEDISLDTDICKEKTDILCQKFQRMEWNNSYNNFS